MFFLHILILLVHGGIRVKSDATLTPNGITFKNKDNITHSYEKLFQNFNVEELAKIGASQHRQGIVLTWQQKKLPWRLTFTYKTN